MYNFVPARNIDNPVFTSSVNSYFNSAGSDYRHWFPIAGRQTLLYTTQFISHILTRVFRERPNLIEAIAVPYDFRKRRSHTSDYTSLCISGAGMRRRQLVGAPGLEPGTLSLEG